MKRILFTLLAAFLGISAFAQCVPNAVTAAGDGYLIPDSATGLKHACAGKVYNETIYIKAFKDTSIFGIVGTTDSIIIDVTAATMGLPSYLTITGAPAIYPANSANNFPHLKLKGDSLACIQVSGTVPPGTTSGSTALSIPFKAYLKLSIAGFPAGDTMIPANYTNYKFIIDPVGTGACIPASIVNVGNANIESIKAIPNPSNDFMQLQIIANKHEDVTIYITNAVGQVVDTKKHTLLAGINYIAYNNSQLASGNYQFVVKNTAGAAKAGRFSKE